VFEGVHDTANSAAEPSPMSRRTDDPLRGAPIFGGAVGSLPIWIFRRKKPPGNGRPHGDDDVSAPPRADPFRFWRRSSVRRILGGLAALAAVIASGTAGYVMLGWKPSDALFMVIITVTGVGFGEVLPLDNLWLRVHTIVVISFGLIAVAYTVAGFVQFVAEGEISQLLGHQRVRRQIDEMRNHTIVAGFGRMGSLLCAELAAAGEPFALIDNTSDRAAEFDAKGIPYVLGDASDENVLKDAGLLRARALVTAIPSDALNVFITLTARQMNPDVVILARAEQPSTQKKLRMAGANHVVVPAAIGAHRMVSLLTNPAAVEFAELVTSRSSLAIEMDEFPIHPRSPLIGLTMREADIGRRTGVVVVAIKRSDGHVSFPPASDDRLNVEDTIVLLGKREGLDHFRKEYQAK
jgi:voltage-gated potassium channel